MRFCGSTVTIAVLSVPSRSSSQKLKIMSLKLFDELRVVALGPTFAQVAYVMFIKAYLNREKKFKQSVNTTRPHILSS
eukprot:240839-Amphidinium_carterae.1